MRDEKVGDVVLYIADKPRQQAEILALKIATHAQIRILTGPQRGQEFEAPWGIIDPIVIRETYREYAIEVRVRVVGEKFFADHGFVRKPNSVATGLPFEASCESGERHSSTEAALDAGIAFAKRKIDGT
jgi:hypothetical protein